MLSAVPAGSRLGDWRHVVGEQVIGTAINMLDIHLPAFLSVIYGNELPKDAIRCVEVGRGGPSEDGEGGIDE